MLFEDLEPQKASTKPKVLDSLSIDELRNYIGDLQAEIVRVEKAIAAKEAHRAAVSGLFKSPA